MNIRYNEGQKSIATRRKQLKQLAMGIVGKQMKNADFLGTLIRKEKDDFIFFLFQTFIANDPSWIIVRKYERSDDYCIYTISDQPNLLKYLKEKEDS